MRGLLVHATAGRRHLERPQEVIGGFEVPADGVDLMDQIFHTDDSIGAWKNQEQCSPITHDIQPARRV